jgi:hypothetical protein
MTTLTVLAVLLVAFTWIAGWSEVARLFRQDEQARIDEIFFEMVAGIDIDSAPPS